MAGETTLHIIGNLTSDLELSYTSSGLAVANFTIASTPRVHDRQTGQMKDGDPLFMRCSMWREQAEQAAASLTKGARVIAVGRLTQRSYETKEGEKRVSTELQVDEIGPSLRWATAQVSRVSAQGGQGRPNGGSAGAGSPQGGNGAQNEPWPSAAPSYNGADAWNQPGTFGDDSPF
ncbi:single-stranded DNA-binding protein [Mycetocola tolaasinivorans]|uniref:Single-stranded DNA-binding protein n=1 Tax=Mycetocola tolaasinivorans TaxID=76635 RepID=A0A3L6ZX14_9MICO|nr:single-stranded DNA-binding protein [Mycetocola tolaasinivorans]RLP72310.1 single-stranded DNA-binding protein [Mycetocola tolaasinivorans]